MFVALDSCNDAFNPILGVIYRFALASKTYRQATSAERIDDPAMCLPNKLA